MLLLTLLPLVGWATTAELTGLESISGQKGWVIGSASLPGAKVGDTAVDPANITYYDSEGFPVTEITKVGWYFAKVTDTTGEFVLHFAAWKSVNFEYIDSEESFNNSVSNGALKLYYAEWTPAEGQDGHDAWMAEQNSFKVAAAKLNDKTQHGQGFPWVVFKSTEVEPCRVMFAQQVYEDNVAEGLAANEPWQLWHKGTKQGLTRKVFFSTSDKKYGVASMPEEYYSVAFGPDFNENPLTGQLYWDSEANDGAGAYVNKFSFFNPETDLKVYFTPEKYENEVQVPTFRTQTKAYDVVVSGVNGQFKAYGEPLPLTAGLITTNKDEINENPSLVNQILAKLQLQDDLQFAAVGPQTFSFRLAEGVTPTTVEEVAGTYVYTYGSDFVDVANGPEGFYRYIIKPTGTGSITVTKATGDNEITAPTYETLTYNGQAQALFAIDNAAKATYGEPVYYVIKKTTEAEPTVADIPPTAEWLDAEDVKEIDAATYYVFAKVDETDEYPAAAVTAVGSVAIAQLQPAYATDETYRPKGAAFTFTNEVKPLAEAPTAEVKGEYYYHASATEITDNATFQTLAADDSKWSTTIPTGKTAADAGKYVYWFVKESTNIKGIAPAIGQYVQATFTKATVTLELAEDNTTGKVKGFTDVYLWKGENKTVITNAPATGIVVNPSTLNLAPTYVIQKRGLGAEATWSDVTDNNVTELGTYRVTARVAEDANIAAATLADAYCFEFEVRKPKAYITITATPSIVGVGSLPVPGISVVWEDGDANTDAVTPNGVEYRYYYYETGHNSNYYGNTSNGLQRGTYYVGVVANNSTNLNALFNTTYHNVTSVTRSAVTVAPSQIEAEIAVQEGEFIYGQPLPLKLKYKSGYGEGTTDAEAIAAFDAATWGNGQLVAKNKETNVEYRLYQRTETHYGREVIVTKYRIPDSYNNYQYLPVGTYTVSANFETGNNSNAASIIAKTAQWTIVAKDINNKDVTYDEDGNTTEFEVFGIGTSSLSNDVFNLSLPYTGEQIVPTRSNVTPFSYAYTDMKAEDYDIEVTGANINAGEKVGTFKVIGKGNFKGETDLKFTISKKRIDVYPISNPELTWAIGSDKSSYENKIDYVALEGLLVGQDNKTVNKYTDFDVKTAKGFKDLKVRRTADVTVGRYPQGAEAYLPEGAEEADNYEFRYRTAPLTVTKGKINLNVKKVNATYNGTTVPEIAYDFEPITTGDNASTLSEVLLDNGNWKTLIDAWDAQQGKWNLKWSLQELADADKGRYRAGQSYKIQYVPGAKQNLENGPTNAELMTSMNYEVKVIGTEATVTIDKADIEFTVLPQNVYVKEDVIKQVKLAAAEAVEGSNAGTVKITKGAQKAGDTDLKKFVAELLTVGDDNSINLAKNQSDYGAYYNIKVNPGTWGLVPSADEFVLLSEASDWDKLTKFNNKTFSTRAVNAVKLTIKKPEMKKNDGTVEKFNWLANEWHAMVLPFAAKVSEISAYFKYAIVNVVNKEGASEGDVVFQMPELTDVIPANVPFCVKVAKDVMPEGTNSYTNTFYPEEVDGNFVVVNPQTKQVSVAADNGDFGYTFDGTYEEQFIKKDKHYLRFLGKNSKWSKIGATSSAVFDMMPYTGYVNLGEGFTGTREVNFIFEEEDGSTTVIKDVDFMNGNKANAEGLYRVDGIKLQSAPTQKGVYIQDGKKFVK